MNFHKKLFAGAFIIFLALLSAGAVMAWTGPLSSPPACTSGNPGCDAPLTIANSAQTKAGGSITVSGGGAMGATSFCLPGSNPTGGCITTWPSGGSGQWTTSGSNIYYNSGNVSINTVSTNAVLDVQGGINNSGTTFLINNRTRNDNQLAVDVQAGTGSGDFVITTSGNVGIGIASPNNLLQVGNSAANINLGVAVDSSNVAMALFGVQATNNTQNGISLELGTNNASSSIFIQRITQYVGIDTNSPTYPLTVNGTVSANAYYYNSDERLKDNIASIASSTALQDILALNPVTFNWKNSASGTSTQIGFIAQQVQQVLPDIVSTDSSGMEAVDYARVTPLLVGAAQAQEAKIDTLQSQVNSQQQEIDQLTAEIKTLEAH